ncbi:transcription antiterminator LicT [Paenibacillus baekrokdamisoli]|uniref:Transcription antiterminator LicT n=1 Tax=Paenibacillus baekrokdamisoli TaxID=1712516 RepID=A0A3G9J141_9BACL|nr:PRD domain-containing protein [Paenibacillus baekrokdamisoli]MBB3069536.1 transcriptional antiterminator [Paenibacillus baekrokdamisoli]BBH24890.1 transcription antiterminator LicT [Paenibacillus baekrokdamisoli]
MVNKDETLRIDRVIGNNVVLVQNLQSGKEFVLMGKGIAFAGKSGDTISGSDRRIEKRFRIDDQAEMVQYHLLLEDMDPEVIRISEQIIQMISDTFGSPPGNKIYLALPSHIQFVVYRLRNGMDIVNPFLYETKMWFKVEYDIAKKAADLISDTFGVQVPDDEAGFLAYHVHSAVHNVPVGQLVKFTNLINELVENIEKSGEIQIPRESLNYVRLITDLRNTVDRVVEGKTTANPLLNELTVHIPKELRMANELADLMQAHLGMNVSKEEIGYLAINLYRLFQTFELERPH